MENNTLLKADNLTKVYNLGRIFNRERIVAVNQANFSLPSNKSEIFTIAGESGSGKTTVAKMILGFAEPSEGRILYGGKDITHIKSRKQKMQFMREIQPVFQNPFETFNPLKRVSTYLFETALNFGIAKDKDDAENVVGAALGRVGLSVDIIRGKYPNEYSGGQLQRVSIARSLITSPSVLVTDEPVSMVDASLRMSIVNLFKDLSHNQGVSVIYITHDLATAYYVSDRIAIMLRGNIVEIGTVETVLDDPKHPYTQILKDSVPEPDPEQKWDKEIALTDLEKSEYGLAGCKFAGRCPQVMDVCKHTDPDYVEAGNRMVKCHLYSPDA
jgi:peptide/nickel transport system ATP-binding protein